MNRSTPGLPVHHQFPEFTQTHVHESVMPSSHLILCWPLLLLPPVPPNIRVFSSESTLRMRWPKYWSFSFSIIPSKEIPSSFFFFFFLNNISFCSWYYSCQEPDLKRGQAFGGILFSEITKPSQSFSGSGCANWAERQCSTILVCYYTWSPAVTLSLAFGLCSSLLNLQLFWSKI